MRLFLVFFLFGCSFSQHVLTHPLTYLYQLQDTNFHYLAALSPQISVIDPQESGLTKEHILQLKNRHTLSKIYAYISIGEAEDYRPYWQKNHWSDNRPSFILSENSDWKGNYTVEYWNKQWQHIILSEVQKLAHLGYDGVYLDIVDGFARPEIISAFGNASGARQAMEDFVITISDTGKAIRSDFAIIPQNAVELLQRNGAANMRYINAIDGIGKESTFYSDNDIARWSEGDVALLDYAIKHKKFVLTTDYPTTEDRQADFINKALQQGYIPFSGYRPLNNAGAAINRTIPARLHEQFVQMPQ